MLIHRTPWLLLLAAAISVAGLLPVSGAEFERLPDIGIVDELRQSAGSAGAYPWGGFGDVSGPPLASRLDVATIPAAALPGEFVQYSDSQSPALLGLDDFPDAEQRRLVWDDICLDHQHFYSSTTLLRSLPVLGAAAALANTPADGEIRDWWQTRVRNPELAEFWNEAKHFGEGKWMIPVSTGAWLVGEWLSTEDSTHWLGQWGGRTTRGYLVGFPVLFSSQLILGSSRPVEGESASHWKFGQDNNSVSGHAFMGAMPFLTAAQLCESPWAKALCFAGSAMVPLSRVEHDAHFASQIILGWWLAYMASSAVDETMRSYGAWQIDPMPVGDGVGMLFTWNR